jgi:hypothetical protein
MVRQRRGRVKENEGDRNLFAIVKNGHRAAGLQA